MFKFYYVLFIIIFLSNPCLEYLKDNKDSEEIAIDGEKEKVFNILGNITYVFSITNERYLYSFISSTKNIFHLKPGEDAYELKPNETFFQKGEIIYVNRWKNLRDTKVTISPVPIYTKLNSFETINEDQFFFIKAEKDSILYFDSFDMNSKVYLSNINKKEILEDDIRINGKFQNITKGSTHFIKNKIFSTSVFQKYFYPVNLYESDINIQNDDKNFFYLVKNKNYTFNFQESTMNKMIKLSKKTPNSKVTIIKDNEKIKTIDKDSPYYLLEEKYEGQLTLKVEEMTLLLKFFLIMEISSFYQKKK